MNAQPFSYTIQKRRGQEKSATFCQYNKRFLSLFSNNGNGSFEAIPLDSLAISGYEAAARAAAATSAASVAALAEELDESLFANGPAKRLKVSDINISRYEEEFVEIREIASGTFGTVKVARHRLDGMVYAIKVIN